MTQPDEPSRALRRDHAAPYPQAEAKEADLARALRIVDDALARCREEGCDPLVLATAALNMVARLDSQAVLEGGEEETIRQGRRSAYVRVFYEHRRAACGAETPGTSGAGTLTGSAKGTLPGS